MKSVAIFLVMLVVTLPFYSANAYASLRITKNAGEDNIDGFVDAQGDLWTLDVEASIPGETITPSRLTMNGYPFQSCAQNPGGVFGCAYSVDFRNRVIPESTVPIEVKLLKQDGTLSDRAASSISFDGTAPVISAVTVAQAAQDVDIRFTLKERPDTCVGVKKIEFFEDSTSLKVLEGSTLDAKLTQKCGDNAIRERMPLSASTATRIIKIVATDKLGHERTVSRSLFFDGQAPAINASSFKAGDFGTFVSGGVIDVVLSIQVKEERSTLTGIATSTALALANKEVQCAKTDIANNIFTCRWDVHADFSQGFTIEITARDGGGRTDTRTFSSPFTVDSTRPVVDYFGTLRQQSGVSYAGGNTTLVAKFREDGSGMDKTRVAANLRELSSTFGSKKYADGCTKVQNVWECYWRGLDVVKSGRVFLSEAKDNVGNPAESLPGEDIVLDRTAPDIVEESLVVKARTQDSSDYYKSGDSLDIAFDVVEANGLFQAEIDESGIVDGGGVDIISSCPLKNGSSDTYHCTHTTARIKSGHILNAVFTLRAEDTAGNWEEADKGIEIFGTDEGTQPSFWNVKKVTCSPEGLDINTMKLINQRVFCTMEFETQADVTLLSTKLLRCRGDEDKLKDKFMVANFGGNRKPGLVLEFKVLDDQTIASVLSGDEYSLDYSCTLRLLTKRGNQVIQQPEEETAIINVTLFESQFDNSLSTIGDEIEDAKDNVKNDLWKLIGTLNEIFIWVKAICAMLPVLQVLMFILDLVDVEFDVLRDIVLTEPIALANCEQTTQQEYSNKNIIDFLQIICLLGSCTPKGYGFSDDFAGGAAKWYQKHQQDVLDFYNNFGPDEISRQGLTTYVAPAKATSLTDNLFLSLAGICIPGIVYNMEKYRQIQCRYIGCLENEVKAGVATVESCRELKDYQECKYIWGEVFQIIPWSGAIDQMLNLLKSILTDPIGAIEMIVVQICGQSFCPESGEIRSVCNFLGVLFKILSIIETMIVGFNQIETATKADYCSQVL